MRKAVNATRRNGRRNKVAAKQQEQQQQQQQTQSPPPSTMQQQQQQMLPQQPQQAPPSKHHAQQQQQQQQQLITQQQQQQQQQMHLQQLQQQQQPEENPRSKMAHSPADAVVAPQGAPTPAPNGQHAHLNERRKLTQEEASLTAKNYRLAKELSELRVRHREECRNVTKLTMENMNLASRCREAVGHVAMLKKELASHQRRTAEAIAVALQQQQQQLSKQEQEDTSMMPTPNGNNSAASTPPSTPSRSSHPHRESPKSKKTGAPRTPTSVGSPKKDRSLALCAEMDRMDRILAEAHNNHQQQQQAVLQQRSSPATSDGSAPNSPSIDHSPGTHKSQNDHHQGTLDVRSAHGEGEHAESPDRPFSSSVGSADSEEKLQEVRLGGATTPPPSPRGETPHLVSSDDYEEDEEPDQNDEDVVVENDGALAEESPVGSREDAPGTPPVPESSSTIGSSGASPSRSPSRNLTSNRSRGSAHSSRESDEDVGGDSDGNYIVDEEDWIAADSDERRGEGEQDADSDEQVSDPPTKSYFPHTASPKIGRPPAPGSGRYNEEFPGDIILRTPSHSKLRTPSQRRLADFMESEDEEHSAQSLSSIINHNNSSLATITGSGASASVSGEKIPFEKMSQRDAGRRSSSNSMSSIDAFEASFAMNIPDSFTPKDERIEEEKKSALGEIYNPFSPSPQRPTVSEGDYSRDGNRANGYIHDFGTRDKGGGASASTVNLAKDSVSPSTTHPRGSWNNQNQRRKLSDPPGTDKTSTRPSKITGNRGESKTRGQSGQHISRSSHHVPNKSPSQLPASKAKQVTGTSSPSLSTPSTLSPSSVSPDSNSKSRIAVDSSRIRPPPFSNNAVAYARPPEEIPSSTPAPMRNPSPLPGKVALSMPPPRSGRTSLSVPNGSQQRYYTSPPGPPPADGMRTASPNPYTAQQQQQQIVRSASPMLVERGAGYEVARARYESAVLARNGPMRSGKSDRSSPLDERLTTPFESVHQSSSSAAANKQPTVKERVAAYVEQSLSPGSHRNGLRRNGGDIDDDDEGGAAMPAMRPARSSGLSSSLARQVESRKANAAAAVAEAAAGGPHLQFKSASLTPTTTDPSRLRSRPRDSSATASATRREPGAPEVEYSSGSKARRATNLSGGPSFSSSSSSSPFGDGTRRPSPAEIGYIS